MKTIGCRNGLCAWLFLLMLVGPAWGLIEVHEGNDPIRELGLPTGARAVADLPCRLGYKVGPPFGGGEYHFSYRCEDTAEFKHALTLFSRIRVPRFSRHWLMSLNGQYTTITEPPLLLLVVHDQADQMEKKRVDWSFTVWCPENFNRLFNRPKGSLDASHPHHRQPVPPPRIDVYLGDKCPIQWEAVQVPEGITVINDRSTPDGDGLGGRVAGAVYDMSSHQVIPGAQVQIVKTSRSKPTQIISQVQADEQGIFSLTGIDPGTFKVYVQAEGYVARNWGAFNNHSGNVQLDTDILLSRPASLAGRVVDQAGQAVPELKVTTRDMVGQDGRGYACGDKPEAVTDVEGRFEIEGLPEGYTHLRCRTPSLHQETSIFELYPVSRRHWSRQEEIKLVVTGTGIIQGTVVDAQGNPPTRQFMVELEPKGGSKRGSWGGSMRIKEDASFAFKGVPPGEYVLIAHPNPMREGEATDPEPIVVAAGKIITLTLRTEHAHKRKR
jgi:hypothetical protein